MVRKLFRFAILAAVLISIVASAYSYFATRKANKFVDQGNALAEEANGLVSQAKDDISSLFSEKALESFPKDRADMEAKARKIDDLLGQAAEKYRACAAKFEEGMKAAPSKPVGEYLHVKAEAFRTMAHSKEAFRQAVRLIWDQSLQTSSELREKLREPLGRGSKLSASYDDLTAKAEEIVSANKDEFN